MAVVPRRPGVPRASEVSRFALCGAIALAVVGTIVVLLARDRGRAEAIRQARELTSVVGRGVVAPALQEGLDRARLDRVVRSRVLRDPIVRIKVWRADGTVVYSDEPRLIGKRFPLEPDEARALRGDTVEAGRSDLRRPENRFERRFGRLLEVYLPVRGRHGLPLLFEAYLQDSSVAAGGRRLWSAFLPAIIAGLVVLWLAQIPMAVRLARRLGRARREREALLRRALDASAVERRRIARDLHDGPVQQLAAVSFALGAASARLQASSEARDLVEGAAADTREAMRGLRSRLVELYPPALERQGIAAALGELLAPLRARDVAAELRVDAPTPLAPAAEAVVFRVAQEALRNVAAHAGAERVGVSLQVRDGRGILEVRDDGRGFDVGGTVAGPHFGLRMLRDFAEEAGGTLDVSSRPGDGARLRLEVPG
jgi:signal transduction histidine kinase